jgi:hypothetical protein
MNSNSPSETSNVTTPDDADPLIFFQGLGGGERRAHFTRLVDHAEYARVPLQRIRIEVAGASEEKT